MEATWWPRWKLRRRLLKKSVPQQRNLPRNLRLPQLLLAEVAEVETRLKPPWSQSQLANPNRHGGVLRPIQGGLQ